MSKKIVSVTGLHKEFKLPHEREGSLKGLLLNNFKRKSGFERQQVINGISFQIDEGDFFGIVGRNGSGKSTLLKLLAGIYAPDKGAIDIQGKLTPFIELGVGFNPDLTGKENVFLNGALLGFNRKEVIEMYDEIVEFAELEKFMDQKLKNYSSGMQVRLAFSIAIRAKSDILLLDEVLAVGDEAFQKKCLAVFERYKSQNQTVILVTHDMSVVEKYCNKAILLSDGDIILEGDPHKIARKYSRMNSDNYEAANDKENERTRKKDFIKEWGLDIAICNDSGSKTNTFSHNSTADITLTWQKNGFKNVGIALVKQSGEYVFGTNTIADKIPIKNKTVNYTLDLNIEPGTYKFVFGFFGDKETDSIEFIDEGYSIIISDIHKRTWGGVTQLKHHWK